MANALELRLDIAGSDHVAVLEMPEVEFHCRLEAPLQRHLIDGDCALTMVSSSRQKWYGASRCVPLWVIS